MGAFLSGLLGAAGDDIKNQSDRAYKEKRQELQDRLDVLKLAIGNPHVDQNQVDKLLGNYDELAQDFKYKSANKSKSPISDIAKMAQKLVHHGQQRAGQQQGQAQGQQDVQQAPGVTAQPQTTTGFSGQPFQLPPQGQAGGITPQGQPAQGGQPAQAMPQVQPQQMTPPIPQSRFGIMTREQERGIQKAAGEEDFETELKHTGRTQQATFDQKLKEVDQLVKQGYPKQEAQQIVFGRAATPAGQKFAPFYISGAQVPQETQVDALGNPIDREKGIYKLEETSGKFYPVNAAPRAGGGADELAKMAKIILAKKGITKPTEEQAAAATKEAGADLFRNKVTNPLERMEIQRNTVRTIMGENQILQAPTHVPGASQRGPVTIPFSGIKAAPTTPALPAPSAPVARAGGAATPTVPAAPTGFTPEVKGMERTRKTNAEVIMQKGAQDIAKINSLVSRHPDWFGPTAGRFQELVKRVGVSDPDIGTLKGALESFQDFLPSLHGFRSKGVLDSWKETLDNPLKNPQYTIAVMRSMMDAAEQLRKSILGRNTETITAAGEEAKAAGKVKRKVYNEATGNFDEAQ